MDENKSNSDAVVLMKTKAGNGMKLLVNGQWLFTSLANVKDVLSGIKKGCSFEAITESA